MTDRRTFIKQAALSAGVIPLMNSPLMGLTDAHEDQLDVSIFSKHLQFLDYRSVGEMAAKLGFNGVDLTVRPKGHVSPENVAIDLPRAISAIELGGSKCSMITTSIESADNQYDRDIIATAAQLGVKHYRTNWYRYSDGISLPDQLAIYQNEIEKLSILNEKEGIIGCYQNHAGTHVGASYWEIYQLLAKANPLFFGTQYDIRHAMAEGGHSWENGLRLLKDKIKVIVLKDFLWGQEGGKWKAINVPIGKGMVDFDAYFKLLKRYGLKPPVSLHFEYSLGGAEKGHSEISVEEQVVFDAMKRDLKAVQKLWKEA